MAPIAHLERGNAFEREFKVLLEENGVGFRYQVAYPTSVGKYIADFVLADSTVVEVTMAGEAFRGHFFYEKKLVKLKEVMADHHLVIVTPYRKLWMGLGCTVMGVQAFLQRCSAR